MCHIWCWALYMHFLIQLEDNTMRYIISLSSSFRIWGISRVIQKINELPRLHRQWVVKLRFDPRQWESRAPRIALLPGVVANLGPGFNCTSDAYYLCDLRETTLIQLINFFICQMEIIITHLIDMLWEINELVFRIF